MAFESGAYTVKPLRKLADPPYQTGDDPLRSCDEHNRPAFSIKAVSAAPVPAAFCPG